MKRSNILAAVLAVSFSLSAAVTQAAPPAFFPPDAQPYGYNLARMSGEIALFVTSGEDPQYYPNTPFQILYIDPAVTTYDFSGGGLTFISSNQFSVGTNTILYLPVFNADDSPPIIPVFPSSSADAESYMFGESTVGGQYEVVIDGVVYDDLTSFVAGPVNTPPLLDGGGTHLITVGMFLKPLSAGVHTVEIRGAAMGTGVLDAFGLNFVGLNAVYTVTVGQGQQTQGPRSHAPHGHRSWKTVASQGG